MLKFWFHICINTTAFCNYLIVTCGIGGYVKGRQVGVELIHLLYYPDMNKCNASKMLSCDKIHDEYAILHQAFFITIVTLTNVPIMCGCI